MNNIKYIYHVQIIDHWVGWHSMFNELDSVQRIYPLDSNLFSNITEFFYKLSKHSDWEGDLRDGTELYVFPHENVDLVIGLKQDNNGFTFIGSSAPLDFDGRDMFLMDEQDEFHELVYEYKEKVLVPNNTQYVPFAVDDSDRPF